MLGRARVFEPELGTAWWPRGGLTDVGAASRGQPPCPSSSEPTGCLPRVKPTPQTAAASTHVTAGEAAALGGGGAFCLAGHGQNLCLPPSDRQSSPVAAAAARAWPAGNTGPQRGAGMAGRRLSLVLKAGLEPGAHVQATSASSGLCHPRMSLAVSGRPVGQAEHVGVPASGTNPDQGAQGWWRDARRAPRGGQFPARASVSKGPRHN